MNKKKFENDNMERKCQFNEEYKKKITKMKRLARSWGNKKTFKQKTTKNNFNWISNEIDRHDARARHVQQ